MIEIKKTASIVWLDLETCGLDPHVHPVLECAAIATDDDLNPVGRPFHRVTCEARFISETSCDAKALEMHKTSGLWQESLTATQAPTEMDLGTELVRWIAEVCQVSQNITAERVSIRPVLGGNSVHFDREFLKLRCYPQIEKVLHYRNLDVSTLHECARRWWPEAHCRAAAQVAHRAVADVEMSLRNAREYREAFQHAAIATRIIDRADAVELRTNAPAVAAR